MLFLSRRRVLRQAQSLPRQAVDTGRGLTACGVAGQGWSLGGFTEACGQRAALCRRWAAHKHR